MSGGAVAVSAEESPHVLHLKGSLANPKARPASVPIITVSLFNGIGDAFKADDVADGVI